MIQEHPIPPHLHELMNTIAARLSAVTPDGHGFAFFVFDFENPNGSMAYISNAQRADVKSALKELIANWDSQSSVPS